jgi:hypothetical protein
MSEMLMQFFFGHTADVDHIIIYSHRFISVIIKWVVNIIERTLSSLCAESDKEKDHPVGTHEKRRAIPTRLFH